MHCRQTSSLRYSSACSRSPKWALYRGASHQSRSFPVWPERGSSSSYEPHQRRRTWLRRKGYEFGEIYRTLLKPNITYHHEQGGHDESIERFADNVAMFEWVDAHPSRNEHNGAHQKHLPVKVETNAIIMVEFELNKSKCMQTLVFHCVRFFTCLPISGTRNGNRKFKTPKPIKLSWDLNENKGP